MDKQEMSLEIQMHAFRLMRTERYRTSATLKEAVVSDFPEAPIDVIEQALSTLARRLLDAQPTQGA